MKARFFLIIICALLWWLPNSVHSLNAKYLQALSAENFLRPISPKCGHQSKWSRIITNVTSLEPLTCIKPLAQQPVRVPTHSPDEWAVSKYAVRPFNVHDKGSIKHAVNCQDAASFVEKTLCSDQHLAFLEDSMALAYQKAQATLPQSTSLKQAQTEWVNNVRNHCQSANCLKRAYQDRLFTLASYLPLLDLANQPIPEPYRMMFKMRMQTLFYELHSKPNVGLRLMRKLQDDITVLNNHLKT